MNLLATIQNGYTEFSKSERKVADVILANPQAVIHCSIAQLAGQAEVSEPTVNRFSRRLGAKGYPDFKLHLAQSLVQGTPFVNRHVDQDDTVEQYSAKIFDSTMAALTVARNELNYDDVARAVARLSQARKISFFGLGASASVAHDAHNKFLRFDTPVMFSDDILMQRMVALNSTEDDVIICFSHTGRTKTLCEVAQMAAAEGAFIIGITAFNSPLADAADIVLSTLVPEDTDVYMPMASRIAQLVVIDLLITGFTLQRGPDIQEKLRRIKASLRDSRFDKR